MDRIIRLYNPYVPLRPIAHLKGHTTPIFFIHLSGDDERIFTMSTDKCLNVSLYKIKKDFFFLKVPA
jgi:hypothetical protein